MPGPTNDFVPFCPTVSGGNLLTQGAYLADPQLAIGNQPGIARSALVNKALRQATYISAAVAQFIANQSGDNVLDDATIANVLASMTKAFKKAPTMTVLTAGAGVYTVPAHVAYLRVRMVGGGAGGQGQTGTAGGNGTDSDFGAGLIAAQGAIGPAGGSWALGVGPIGTGQFGQDGSLGTFDSVSAHMGGFGGSTPFGGGGYGGYAGVSGKFGYNNSGAGGGGSSSQTVGVGSGRGGGGGGYVDAVIAPGMTGWAATFNYTVGAGGAAGAATGGGGAGAGGSGKIIIEEHY